MAAVLPLAAHELEFLERLNGAGDIAPELLTDDAAMQALIRDQPGLKWKALNVKKRLGGGADDGQEPPVGSVPVRRPPRLCPSGNHRPGGAEAHVGADPRPSGFTGRIRGMKEPRGAHPRRPQARPQRCPAGADLAACWEETLDAGPYDVGEQLIDWGKLLFAAAPPSTAGPAREPYRAFVPAPLPPAPPLELTAAERYR
jgi:hypothetical protein